MDGHYAFATCQKRRGTAAPNKDPRGRVCPIKAQRATRVIMPRAALSSHPTAPKKSPAAARVQPLASRTHSFRATSHRLPQIVPPPTLLPRSTVIPALALLARPPSFPTPFVAPCLSNLSAPPSGLHIRTQVWPSSHRSPPPSRAQLRDGPLPPVVPPDSPPCAPLAWDWVRTASRRTSTLPNSALTRAVPSTQFRTCSPVWNAVAPSSP